MQLAARCHPQKLIGAALLLLVIVFQFSFSLVVPALAADPVPTPNPAPGLATTPAPAGWQFDPLVDEAGKNAERARELLYWVFSHPPRNRATVLARMWSISRNIVYVFFLLVLAVGGIGFIVARRQGKVGPVFSGIASPLFGFEVPAFIFKVAAFLLYVTFSYVFVLGLLEFAQILMDFFIRYLGGCNLFNINFGKATECIFPGDSPAALAKYQALVKEMEKNYTDFVGYRNFTPAMQEMANTSIFFVKLTTLTYNAMSVMLILRHTILWFLLIVAPFLALFMPFVFIRNIGWIWIGVFMQWLFYGPLLALFVAGLVKIWEAGIPYGFDWSRVGDCANTPFKTSINILWGGPAQTLGQCNSANYIDTYAEYVISLVMLWAAILLPWLLLRIFRDYCCDILRQNQATLQAILNRLRSLPPFGPSPAKTPPAKAPAKPVPLPFRRMPEEKRKVTEQVKKIEIEKLRDISKVRTRDISKALNVSVEKLRDIATIETNATQRRQLQEQLRKIAHPAQIANTKERQQYRRLRNELSLRAKQGDVVAARILESVAAQRPRLVARDVSTPAPRAISRVRLQQTAQLAQVPEEQVKQVVELLPTVSNLAKSQQIESVAKETGLSQEQTEKVLATLPQTRPQIVIRRVPQALPAVVSATQIQQTAKTANVSEQDVTKVVRLLPSLGGLSAEEQIAEVANQTNLDEQQAEQVLLTLAKTSPVKKETTAAPKVTVADYEEVKSMWVSHYRKANIPQSTRIKTRTDWLQADIKKITNAINLLEAKQAELREEALKEVEKILPFLLLGGFSDEETLVYLKAKLEAAKQVQEELEKRAGMQAQEEELVEVSVGEKTTKEGAMEAAEAQEMELPLPEEAEAAPAKANPPPVTEQAKEKAGNRK